MRGSKSFVRGGPTLTTFLYIVVNEGREDPNTTLSRPSLARRKTPFYMAFRCRAHDGQTLNAGFVALLFLGDPDQYC